MASNIGEQEEEEEPDYHHILYPTERYYRYPHDFNDPDRRLLRLGDHDGDRKAWVSPAPKGMTFELISKKHQQYTKEWRKFPEYQTWISIMEQTVMQQQKLKITSCMCLGLGPFCGFTTKSQGNFRDRSLAQLVVFESLVDLLKTKFTIEHIYFQEPRFSELDMEFLRSKGYEILHTPDSDDHMTGETFLFTPGAEQVVVNSSLEAAFPGLYLMHQLTEHYRYHMPPLLDRSRIWENKLPAPDQKARRNLIAAFMDQFVVKPLPKFEWHDPLDYWISYKPDSEAEIEPWEWEFKEEDWFTEEEAKKIWREKGLPLLESSDEDTSCSEDDSA